MQTERSKYQHYGIKVGKGPERLEKWVQYMRGSYSSGSRGYGYCREEHDKETL